jgi:hypothetical protein
MSENRKRILDMLAQGKISVDEAERLLTAVEQPDTGGTGFSAVGETSKGERKYLRVVVEPNADAGSEVEQHRVNIRVPMALIRAGVKLTSLIPSNATTKINEELRKSGVDFDVSSIKTEDLDQLVDAMKDLEVDIQGGNEGKVKVYFE